MNEDEIAAQVKQNIPVPDTTEVPQKATLFADSVNTVRTELGYPLDEMTQYKLHEFFGEQYRTNDVETRQQLSFIYDKASELAGSSDYSFVVAKMRDIERIIGTSRSDNRLYKLYQWLKLDAARRKIDAEMGALNA